MNNLEVMVDAYIAPFKLVAWNKAQRIDPDGAIYKRLCVLLDQADDETIVAIRNADIPFVSLLALNRMIQRGLIRRVGVGDIELGGDQ